MSKKGGKGQETLKSKLFFFPKLSVGNVAVELVFLKVGVTFSAYIPNRKQDRADNLKQGLNTQDMLK